MIIRKVELSNFRQYKKKSFVFSPKSTVILGENASGKTNLLESVFILAAGGSFKADQDRETISFTSEVGRIKGDIMSRTNEKTILEVVLSQGIVLGQPSPMKRYLVNGVGKRVVDFVGRLIVVLFWPQDLELVTDSPGKRRRYLDFVLMQTDREYRRTLRSYEKGVRQRNKVLEAIRDRGAERKQLLFWDQLLIKSGSYITKKREEYISFINRHSNPSSKDEGIPKYEIYYDKSTISEVRLNQYSEEEIAAAVTLVGPHRDDIKFQITNNKEQKTEETGRDLSLYGSRGEQRLAILWLKLNELAYIEKTVGEKPVLLLDDIFSELDEKHRKLISSVTIQQQTIITTTDLHHLEKESLKDIEVVRIP
ncbi:MAG: DNA replication and repair protein RecF [Patescibacteria group bacterium]|nr:DNA replication and repair protein RecF [Patescibacteria group bacterium]